MAEPQPVILDNASLVLNGTEMACLLSHIEITPDVSTTEVKTMCGAKDYPGTVKWALNATLYQSFDAAGTHEVLQSCINATGPVPFVVRPFRDGTEPSEANPEFWGDVIPQPYTLLSGDAGEASSVELEWSIDGSPKIDPPDARDVIAATGATAGSPGSFTPAGATTPADLADLSDVTASPATAWTTGQHVVTADSTHAHWDGAAWATGDATF